MSGYILSFLAYAPRVYSAFDRYNLLLAKKTIANGDVPVFVFADSMREMPIIQHDLEEIGAIVELIPSHNKFQQTKAAWELYKKYHPIIVHTHFVNYLKITTLALSLLYGAKHFTSFHSMITDCPSVAYKRNKGVFKMWGLRLFCRLLSKYSQNVFTVSKMIYEQFCDYAGKVPKNVQSLYLGVDTMASVNERMAIRKLLSLPQDAIVICNISAKEHIKGIDVLLKAFARLQKLCPTQKVTLVHIGGLRLDNEFNRKYEQDLIRLSESLNLTNVKWLGNRTDVADLMPAFDIYVHPSRSEGIGTVFMEAAVESLPLIGTNVGGIPEIVHDGVNGYLCNVEDVEGLAERMSRLVSDVFLRKDMGDKSHELLLQKFDIDQQTNKLLQYYLV